MQKYKTMQSYVTTVSHSALAHKRGQLLEEFRLSEQDLIEIENFLKRNKKVSVKPTKFGLS